MIVEFLSNKKKVKRLAKGLLSMMLSLIIGLSSLAIFPYVSPTAEAATQYTSGYYTYERLDSVHAKIVDVDSNISGAVTIPETLDGYTVSVIGRYAFSWLQNITSVVVPSGVTTIDNGAFSGCSKLSSVSLPKNLTYIYDRAFNGCDALKNIVIPDSTIYLGSYAFAYCDSLSSVSLGAKLTRIGSYAFYNCENLAKFSVSSSNTRLKLTNGALVLDYGLICYPAAKSGTSFTIPSGITSLEPGAFSMCKNLKKVTIPNSVVRITYNVFEDCENLTTVSLPSSVKKIGYSSFSGCSSLNSIDISNVNELDTGVFSGCSSLTSITLSDKLTEIPGSLFSGCEKLKSIKIPDSVTIINKAAFSGCTSLSTISLGKNISKIRSRAFLDTGYYNNSANWENGVLYLGDYLIASNNTVDKVIVKSDCSLIADSAFYFNDKLTSIRIPNDSKEDNVGVKHIGDLAFSYCDNLSEVYLGEGIKEIGPEAFCYCNNLKSVILPKGVTTIAYGAFEGCYQLEKVHLPNTVKRIESSAFGYCDALKKVYYFGTSSQYKSISVDSYQNDAFNKAKKEYPYSQEHVILDYSTRNENYVGDKISYAYTPMDGTYGNPDFCIPGQDKSMIPQGLAYYKEKNWLLISAYNKVEDGEKKSQSVIFALDFDTGTLAAQFNLLNTDGKDYTGHVGGIAVSKQNLYVCWGKGIAYIPLSELEPNNVIKNIQFKDKKELSELKKDNKKDTESANCSYIDCSDGVLWAGNFYNYPGSFLTGNPGWRLKPSKKYNSVLLGYKLSGDTPEKEWESINKSDYYIGLPNSLDSVQGATVKKLEKEKYQIFLSRTDGASFSSEINSATIDFKSGKYVYPKKNSFVSANNISGAQNIIYKDGCIYCAYESAALWYRGDFFWKEEFKDITDVIWCFYPEDILTVEICLQMFNCPIDIEVYDSTGKLVGRTVNNIVDETAIDVKNNVVIEVDGETKSLWTPSNKNYTVKIVGNGEGTMDYSVMKFDPELNETVRTNFFDVEISNGLVLNGDLKLADDDFDLSEYRLVSDSGEIVPSESFNNSSKTVSINISGTSGGEVDESFDTVSGDYISVFAIPNEGYVLEGWYENDVLVSTDTEYSFVAKNDRSLVAKFEKFVIKNPSTTTINYGDSIILHAGIDGTLPAGTYIEWTSSNGNFTYSVSEDGTTCTISPSASGSTVFTATIYDSEGNELATDEQEMTSNAGFFQKIIAFFKKLFGLTKTIPQVYKGIF